MTNFDPEHASSSFCSFANSVRSTPRSREEHESYDVGALAGLRGGERREAERIVIEVLCSARSDVRAVDALSVLGTPSALDALAAALPGLLARGCVGVALSAVEVLNQDGRVSRPDIILVARTALQHGAIHHQTRAARLLAQVDGENTWRLLLDVIAAMPLAFVRAQLYELCLDALGVEQGDRELPGNLATLGELVGAHCLVARDAGLAELAPIALRLSQGLRGAEAGVRRGEGKRAARAARAALRSGEAVDIESLSDSGRDYLGAWILGQLPTDVHAHYRALERLKPPLGVPVLTGLVRWSDDELGGNRRLIVSALAALDETQA